MCPLKRKNFFYKPSWLGLSVLLFICVSTSAAGHESGGESASGFRWIHAVSDPQVWQQIQSAFQGELTPDQAKEGQDALDVYQYKYLQMVGILNHSALVIIGYRPTKELSKETSWDEYYSAFNFNLVTRQKSIIKHAEQMWKWKFHRLATFGPSRIPDVTFNYMTCTECEPDFMFASLHYDSASSEWQVRSWGDGQDIWWTAADGLVVDMDLIDKEDIISFDCAYGILESKMPGYQDLAIRCKEIRERDKGRAKIDDITLLYSSSSGQFKSTRITDESEIAGLTANVCRPKSESLLCKLPAYMTVTGGQNSALDEMFPNSPKTSRELADFRKLKATMSMTEIAHRCGEPDEVWGSGIAIFIYHLRDGTLVAIGATGATGPILGVNHIKANGKSSPLLPTK